MKRMLSLALVLVMLSALFTGCGCMDNTVSEHPGGIITDPTTMPTVLPTPTATHRPEETTTPRDTAPNSTEGGSGNGGTGSMNGGDGSMNGGDGSMGGESGTNEGGSGPMESTGQRNRSAKR